MAATSLSSFDYSNGTVLNESSMRYSPVCECVRQREVVCTSCSLFNKMMITTMMTLFRARCYCGQGVSPEPFQPSSVLDIANEAASDRCPNCSGVNRQTETSGRCVLYNVRAPSVLTTTNLVVNGHIFGAPVVFLI